MGDDDMIGYCIVLKRVSKVHGNKLKKDELNIKITLHRNSIDHPVYKYSLEVDSFAAWPIADLVGIEDEG